MLKRFEIILPDEYIIDIILFNIKINILSEYRAEGITK